MTRDGRRADPVHDPALVRAALPSLNEARRAPEHSRARLGALLSGFEALAAALPGEDRAPGAAEALDELEALLAEGSAAESVSDAAESGSGTTALRAYLEPVLERLVEALLDHPERRLAAYGSLLPGENNHHHVAMLVGRWVGGTVEGTLHDRGWGAREGYPGFVSGVPGDRVAVKVFESLSLPAAWDRLDAFEGAAYRRILAPVEMRTGTGAGADTECRVCNIYELTDLAGGSR